MAEYCRKFIKLEAPPDEIPEKIHMGKFVNGLNEDLKAKLRVINKQAIKMAGWLEEPRRVCGSKRPNATYTKSGSITSYNKGLNMTTNSYGVHPKPDFHSQRVTGIDFFTQIRRWHRQKFRGGSLVVGERIAGATSKRFMFQTRPKVGCGAPLLEKRVKHSFNG